MAIDPGTRAVRFLPQGRRYSSINKNIARLGLYLHRYDEHFNKANRLPGNDLKTAAITGVSKLISFCVFVAYSMYSSALAALQQPVLHIMKAYT